MARPTGALPAALVLLAALLIAFLASRPPTPSPQTAAASRFSAERAMLDIERIAQAPRPTGSAENERARAYLTARMRQLGMAAATQSGPLPPEGRDRLRKWGSASADGAQIVNLIGVMPGRDRTKAALLLMAHHDSVWASPGAADDAAGVAAALEIARALQARGRPERDVILLFTDAEELGLDGAELFFGQHPLAGRVGVVVNMETRGGGGRTAMFETGRSNGEMVALYRRSVARPFANSMAVLVYERMPNNTDFTIPKRLGVPGFNFAFIGRSALYHSPFATPQAIDRGSVQDLGDQALGVAAALAFAAALPEPAPDAIFGDLLGLFIIAYDAATGWALLALSIILLGFAWVKVRGRVELTARAILGGAALSFATFLHAALLLRVGNLLSGSGGPTNYYDRLAALPRLEAQALLFCLSTLLLAPILARSSRHLLAAAPALGLAALGIALEGWSGTTFGLGAAAAIAALLIPPGRVSLWSGWLGSVLLALLAALAIQLSAPTAGPVMAWPIILAALGAALAAAWDQKLERLPTLIFLALLAGLGAGQLLYLAHFTFLGVGAGRAEVMALYAWLVAMLLWPLLKLPTPARVIQVSAALLLVAGILIALSVRFDPIANTVPPYSEQR